MDSALPATPSEPTMTPQNRHRRETWLQIILPMLGGGLLMLALLSSALLLQKRDQVSLIADFMLTVMVLCPLALCLFPIYLGMVLLVFGMNKVHNASARQMKRAEDLSRSTADKTIQLTDSLNRKSIGINAAFAPLNRLWRVFDQPNKSNPTEEKHDPTNAKP